MISLLICFILSFSETAVYVSALEVFTQTKDWFKKHKWLYVFIATIFYIIDAYTLDEVFYIRMGVSILSYIIIACLIVNAKTTVKLSLALTYHNFLVMLEYSLMLIVVKITMFRNIDPSLVYDYYELHMIIAEVIINIIIVIVCCKNRGRLIETMKLLRDKEWLNVLFISFVSSLILTITVKESGMVENYYVDVMVICVDVVVVILDFSIVGLFIQSVNKQKSIVENEAILARVKNEISLYRTMSDNLERQKRKSHEYNNHLAAIKGMLEQGQIVELQEYVSVIVDKEKKLTTEINTYHVIINAILNTKYEETRQKDITFIIKVNDLSGITISDEDIVVLLSNLLNNAIEACEKSKEKMLKLKFVIEDDQIILSVKNSIADLPVSVDGELISSKEDKEDSHGIGMKNIIGVIEKYSGRYVIDFDEKWFSVSTIIPL